MKSLLQWLTDGRIPEGEISAHLALTGLAAGMATLLFAVGAAGILFAYRSRGATVIPGRRLALCGLRLAAWACVVLLLSRPVLSLRIEEPVRSTLLVLIDDSASMGLADVRESEESRSEAERLAGTPNPTRADLVRALAKNSRLDLFPRLAAVADLKVESFGERLRLLAEAGAGEGAAVAGAVANLGFDESGTAIGSAVEESLANWRGLPIAGILVISDGASNLGKPVGEAARLAAREQVPVYAFGTGVEEVKDLELSGLQAPPLAFVYEQTEVRVRGRLSGYEGARPVRLEVFLGDQLVEAREVTLDREAIEVAFLLRPDKAGELPLRVVAAPLEGEATGANNSLGSVMRVTDQKVEVLYLDDVPRWDFRYIVDTLKDDRRVALNVHLIRGDRGLTGEAGATLLDTMPDPGEMLEFQVVILGDVSPEQLGAAHMEALKRMVGETGGGLVFLAGPISNPGAYRDTPLEPLLPIQLGAPIAGEEAVRRLREPVKAALTPAGAGSALLQLDENPAESAAGWERLGGIRWFYRGAVAKPTAETLATVEGGIPLIALQTFGRGQSLYFGTDETYRWRSKLGGKAFVTIWAQIIQTLALERMRGASSRVQLRVNRPVVGIGEEIVISGRVYDEAFQPLREPRLEGEIQSDSGDRRPLVLEASSETPGLYSGSIPAWAPGRYVFVPFRDPEAEIEFEVRAADREMRSPAMNRAALESLARETGGRYLDLDSLAELPDRLKARGAVVPRHSSLDLFNHWILLALAVIFLTGEWTMRRLWRLK